MTKYGGWLAAVCLVVTMIWPAGVEADEWTVPELQRTTAGAMFGYEFEVEDPLLGLESRFTFEILPNIAASFNPAVNYFFMSPREFPGGTVESSLFQVDANVLGHLVVDGPVEPYAGIGLAIQHARIEVESFVGDAEESETGLGLNVLVGTEVSIEGPLAPFVQLRVTISDLDNIDHANFFAAMGGLAYSF